MENIHSTVPTKDPINVPVFRDVMTVVETQSPTLPYARGKGFTIRDMLAVIFRHRSLIIYCFLLLTIITVVVVFSMPRQYESRMKLMIRRERSQMVLTPLAGAQAGSIPDITQEDINSEVEILRSRDLLEQVVIECGLNKSKSAPKGFWAYLKKKIGFSEKKKNEALAVPLAVSALADALNIETIPKSHLIDIRYKASDPQSAARALNSLSALYLDKHLAVHNPSGVLNFFQQQMSDAKKNLESIELQLTSFQERKGVLSFELEKDLTLRTLNDFESRLRENDASVSALDHRIASLRAQIDTTPDRVTSQVRVSDHSLLIQQLKTTLLNLELKRTELLTKFEPGYRLVQEVDIQIAQARSALAEAEKNTMKDETTDLNKTHAWLEEELARAEAERATLRARSISLLKSIGTYKEEVLKINRSEAAYHDLSRSAKSTEEKFLLYQTKQEEARISDAMDRKRIVNAVIVEAPTIPPLPAGPGRFILVTLGIGLATVASMGVAFVADYANVTFRTPDEVESRLGLPVLASVPLNPHYYRNSIQQ